MQIINYLVRNNFLEVKIESLHAKVRKSSEKHIKLTLKCDPGQKMKTCFKIILTKILLSLNLYKLIIENRFLNKTSKA